MWLLSKARTNKFKVATSQSVLMQQSNDSSFRDQPQDGTPTPNKFVTGQVNGLFLKNDVRIFLATAPSKGGCVDTHVYARVKKMLKV